MRCYYPACFGIKKINATTEITEIKNRVKINIEFVGLSVICGYMFLKGVLERERS